MQMEVTKRKAKGVLGKMLENIDEESLAKTREEMMSEHPIVYTREIGQAARDKVEGNRVFGTMAFDIWKKFAGSNSIGNCDEMCQMICGAFMDNAGRLPTDQEYLDTQIDYAESQEKRLKIHSRGPTWMEWWMIGEKLRNAIKKEEPTFTCSAEDCLQTALYHTVTETMMGKRAEKELIDNMISGVTKKEVEYPSGADDAFFGVDFFAYFGKNADKYGIQVKPITFYMGKKSSTVEDNEALLKKSVSAIEHFGLVGMLYAIYERRGDNNNEWFYKEVNGRKKFLFTIDELYDVDKKVVTFIPCGRVKYKKCPINIS